MKKINKLITVFVMALLAITLVSCGGGDNTEIAILVPGATHGWPVGVVYYAGESAKQLEAEGHKVKVITSSSSTDQASKIEDLLTLKSLKGIVILPFDNDVKAAVQKIEAANIPFVMFDRVIEGVNSSANVQGDNHGIGYETARVMVEKGLLPGMKVLEMPGDNSSVPTMRSNGFREYLTEEAGWTEAQLANIEKTDFTGWSRETSETLFSNWLDAKDNNALAEYEYIFTHDDEIALGVMDVVRRSNRDLTHVKVLASSAGKQEYYNILNNKPTNGWVDGKLSSAYLFSVTYPPYMIQDSVNTLIDILDGKTVAKNIVIPVEIVHSGNASEYLNADSPY